MIRTMTIVHVWHMLGLFRVQSMYMDQQELDVRSQCASLYRVYHEAFQKILGAGL